MAAPSPDLVELGRLVGTWKISGEAQGTAIYEWMEGGFFLLQHVEMDHGGTRIVGLEVIGHERPFEGEPSDEIQSRFYDSTGNTLDYVYELAGDTLTIWGGKKGSPAYYRGVLTDDDTTLTGGWTWPGGGYTTTATRAG